MMCVYERIVRTCGTEKRVLREKKKETKWFLGPI